MRKNELLLIGGFIAILAAINVVLVLTRQVSWTGVVDRHALAVMIAAGITIAVITQLYKENPLSRLAEHMFVGAMLGYGLIQTWYNIWVNEIFPGLRPLKVDTWAALAHPLSVGARNRLGVWTIIGASILGLLMYTRLSRKYSWVSRIPFALLIGFGVGFAIPNEIKANLLKQLEPMMVDMVHNADGAFAIQWRALIVFVGVMSTLVYFFFSLEHKGAVGVVSKIGVWFLMVAFGASFGYAVMGRLSLLIGRVDFLFRDWIPLIQ